MKADRKDKVLIESAYQKVLEMAYGVSENSQFVTQDELVQKLLEYEQEKGGADFVGITTVTPARTKVVRGEPYVVFPGLKNGKAFFGKVSQSGGGIGMDYTAGVNRQREREGKEADFEAGASIYSSLEGSKVLQTLGDQIYFYYRPSSSSKEFRPVYVKPLTDSPDSPEDFEVVDKEEVQQYMSKSRGSGYYQGLDNAVEARKVSLNSIAAISFGGNEYVISDLDPLRKNIYKAAGAPMPQ